MVARMFAQGPVTQSRLRRSVSLYVFLAMAGLMLPLVFPGAIGAALGAGLMVPGGGFLVWADMHGGIAWLALVLAFAFHLLFWITVGIWFATGNIILPPLTWAAAALVSAAFAPATVATPYPWSVPFTAVTIIGWAALEAYWFTSSRKTPPRTIMRATTPIAATPANPIEAELSLDDLRLMRVILDRALQPMGSFDGFEWIDQFQTAAVRYQLNFMSYALSFAQANHLSAFDGYLAEAQHALARKQCDHRVWRYWALENSWGNLRRGVDPIPHENIMFTGFVAAQLGLARRGVEPLTFAHPAGQSFRYSHADLIDLLTAQYRTARFGLLACEPNWIYPLCNAITACAIRAHEGGEQWATIEQSFRSGLENEFTRGDGWFVPCRSSLTGLALPSVGGAVMQSFPCLFFNPIFPDIAQRHWERFRRELDGRDWHRAFWPVDTGNYHFSRASSYAATAAAAVEMGDAPLARELMARLDHEYPSRLRSGSTHRSGSSLWAHSVELVARCGRSGGLRSMVTNRVTPSTGPRLTGVSYPDLLVAKASCTDEQLTIIVYPGTKSGAQTITIDGLIPRRTYVIDDGTRRPFAADHIGKAHLRIEVHGRTAVQIMLKAEARR